MSLEKSDLDTNGRNGVRDLDEKILIEQASVGKDEKEEETHLLRLYGRDRVSSQEVEIPDVKTPMIVKNLPDEIKKEEKEERKGNVTYGIDDAPPWYLCLFLALQHYLTMIGAIVAIPFILCPALCMEETDPDRSNIISTMIFVTEIDILLTSGSPTASPA